MTTFAAWRATRSGAVLDEVGEIKQRARTFANSVSNLKGGATLLAQMNADGDVQRYVIADARAESVATNAAAVVGANIERCAELPDLSAPVLARAVVARGKHLGIETQSGSQIDLVSEAFDRNAIPGDWIAIHLEGPKSRQREASREWRRGTATHHSLDPSALVATITAGSMSFNGARALIGSVTSAMPGFDLNIKVVRISIGAGVPLAGVAAAAAFGAGIACGYAVDGALVAALPAGIFAWGSDGHWPHYLAGTRAKLERGIFPAPGGSVKKSNRTKEDGTPIEIDYPLAPNTFMLGPDVAIGLLAVQATGSTESAMTRARRTPSALLSNIGPLLGEGAHMYAPNLFTGTFMVGQAGWGKSVALRSVFGWAATDAARDLGIPGSTGTNTAIAAFENKGEGADYYQRWAQIAGLDLIRMDVTEVSTPAINLFVGDTYLERARSFASAMKEAWSENNGGGAIQYKSLETLTTLFAAALWCVDHPPITETAIAEAYAGAGVIDYAGALAHATIGEPLGEYIVRTCDDREVYRAISTLYGKGVTPSRRAQDLDAPRNKIEVLAKAKEWFAPGRAVVTWDELLRERDAIVLNFGQAGNGRVIDDEAGTILSRMTSAFLKSAVQRVCGDWERENAALYIFADELSMLVGDTGDHIEWLREKARSYGVRLVVATQMLDQLPEGVRRSVKNYGNILWFAQNSEEIVAQAVADLCLSGDEWTGSDVANLPRYHVAARLIAYDQRQSPFTTKIDYFESAPSQPWDASAWFDALEISESSHPVKRETPSRAWLHRPSDESEQPTRPIPITKSDAPSGGASPMGDAPFGGANTASDAPTGGTSGASGEPTGGANTASDNEFGWFDRFNDE